MVLFYVDDVSDFIITLRFSQVGFLRTADLSRETEGTDPQQFG